MENKFVYNFVRNVNKQNPKQVATNLLNEVKEGNLNVLEAFSAIKRIETIVKHTIDTESKQEGKKFKEEALNEVRKYTKDGTRCNIYGADFVATSVHTWYDFSVCNDPLWESLDNIEKKVKHLKKAREEELKTIPSYEGNKLTRAFRTEVINKLYHLDEVDCGEEYNLYAPNKNQREGVKVSIK